MWVMMFFFVNCCCVEFQFQFVQRVVLCCVDFFLCQLVVGNWVKVFDIGCNVVICDVLYFKFVYVYEICDLFEVDCCIVYQLYSGGFCYNWFCYIGFLMYSFFFVRFLV